MAVLKSEGLFALRNNVRWEEHSLCIQIWFGSEPISWMTLTLDKSPSLSEPQFPQEWNRNNDACTLVPSVKELARLRYKMVPGT